MSDEVEAHAPWAVWFYHCFVDIKSARKLFWNNSCIVSTLGSYFNELVIMLLKIIASFHKNLSWINLVALYHWLIAKKLQENIKVIKHWLNLNWKQQNNYMKYIFYNGGFVCVMYVLHVFVCTVWTVWAASLEDLVHCQLWKCWTSPTTTWTITPCLETSSILVSIQSHTDTHCSKRCSS